MRKLPPKRLVTTALFGIVALSLVAAPLALAQNTESDAAFTSHVRHVICSFALGTQDDDGEYAATNVRCKLAGGPIRSDGPRCLDRPDRASDAAASAAPPACPERPLRGDLPRPVEPTERPPCADGHPESTVAYSPRPCERPETERPTPNADRPFLVVTQAGEATRPQKLPNGGHVSLHEGGLLAFHAKREVKLVFLALHGDEVVAAFEGHAAPGDPFELKAQRILEEVGRYDTLLVKVNAGDRGTRLAYSVGA